MSHAPLPLPDSAANDLLAELALYEAGLARLATNWDAGLFSELAGRFEAMRGHAARVPNLTGPWVQVLITRFELADALWHGRTQPGSIAVRGLVQAHLQAIEALRAQCRKPQPHSM